MTLVLAAQGLSSIWLLTDRRLSFAASRRPPVDGATKVMELEVTDGRGLLGYAGLGATAIGNEPGEWMARVLRGRRLPFEQCLGVLAGAIQREIPQHIFGRGGAGIPGHVVLVPAIVQSSVRVYAIQVTQGPNRHPKLVFTRIADATKDGRSLIPPRFVLAGSGAAALAKRRDWARPLLRLINAFDHGKVGPTVVASALATICRTSAAETCDGSVSEACTVIWRAVPGGHHIGGNAHVTFENEGNLGVMASLPSVANGIDLGALIGAIMPLMQERLERLSAGLEDAPDADERLSEAVKVLPSHPDERLR